MKAASTQLKPQGTRNYIVSTAGTPFMWQAQPYDVFTEYLAGTYVFIDRFFLEAATCTEENCAAVIVSTVVSMPTPERLVIDAGSKSLTSDMLRLQGFGRIVGYSGAQIDSLSEKQGVISVDANIGASVGDRILIIPNHVCVVSNLSDSVWLKEVSGEYVRLSIDARGCVG